MDYLFERRPNSLRVIPYRHPKDNTFTVTLQVGPLCDEKAHQSYHLSYKETALSNLLRTLLSETLQIHPLRIFRMGR